MSAIDKANLVEKLLSMGWKEVQAEEYHLVPPDSLWEDKPKAFYVYDAVDIQSMLGDSPYEEEED